MTTTTKPMKMNNKREVICEHCKHPWDTICTTKIVTCAGCGLKTKNNLENNSEKSLEGELVEIDDLDDEIEEGEE